MKKIPYLTESQRYFAFRWYVTNVYGNQPLYLPSRYYSLTAGMQFFGMITDSHADSLASKLVRDLG